MFNTAIVSFFILGILACVERMLNQYMKRGIGLSGVMPWLVLMLVLFFLMAQLPFNQIAMSAEQELVTALHNLAEYARTIVGQ